MNNNIKVSIYGRNINNYLKWLIRQDIELYKINIINYKELEIIIDKKDYNKLKKYSKTYKIRVTEECGKARIISFFKKNILMLSSILLSIIVIHFLSNIIFSIDIISNDRDMIKIISKELEKYNIKKYTLKKNIDEINIIKEKILKDNNDVLEWLEITNTGTKYIVKFVERKKEKIINEYTYQSIAASKNAIITDIRAYSGEKAKKINDYISKDEIAINGIIKKPDGTNIYSKANGYIYGEVWYKIEIEYPYTYYEEKITGKNKNVLSFSILNHKLSLFPYKHYKEFKTKENYLIKDLFNIFKISFDKEYEEIIYDEVYTKEEAIIKAKNLARSKLLKGNNKIIGIKDLIVLSKEDLNSKIKLTIFISTEEDITKIIEIKKEEIENNYVN